MGKILSIYRKDEVKSKDKTALQNFLVNPLGLVPNVQKERNHERHSGGSTARASHEGQVKVVDQCSL